MLTMVNSCGILLFIMVNGGEQWFIVVNKRWFYYVRLMLTDA